MWISLWMVAAQAGVSDDVARGWYLWNTGQDEAAHELAVDLAAAHPDRYDTQRLAIAMEVVQGEGASVEARYREWWNEDRDDPLRRVALAFTLAQRHGDKGGWCDEVVALLAPLDEGEARYWAALASRQRDLRCTGDAGHSDAELRRIASDAAKASEDAPVGALGWAEGVVARMDAGYLKEDLPDDLKALFEAEPHRLAHAGVLWGPNVSGPAKAGARRVASKALSDAVEGDEPMLVHAALIAYTEAGKTKPAEEAAARLTTLDASADPTLVRSVDDVRDPPVYDAIAACFEGFDRDRALGCLDDVEGVPESGAIAAHWHSQRRSLLDVAKKGDPAYEAARAAWQADPDHRFNARLFAKRAVSRGEDLSLAADAMAPVVADRVVPDGNEGLAGSLASDLLLRSRALLGAERGAEALDDQRRAVELAPGPVQRTVLGLVLAAAERPDDAALQLAHGLAVAFDDTALIARGRKVLAEVAGDWHPGGMAGMIDEAARALGDEPTRDHPLTGKAFPLDDLLPQLDPDAEEADPDAEPPPDPTTVVLLWAPWHDESARALERLASVTERYADRGVSALAIDVGLDPAEVPDDLGLENVRGEASAMRAMKLVALPSLVVLDLDDSIVAVIGGWDRGALQLEDALDDLLPEDEDEDDG